MDGDVMKEIRFACADAIARFAYLVDHRYFDGAAALFTEDAIFERPDLTARGRDEIKAIWNARPPSVITRHLCQTPFFTESGIDRASSVTCFTLYQADLSAEGPPLLKGPRAIAEFHDRFRRTAEGWQIAHRKSIVILRKAD